MSIDAYVKDIPSELEALRAEVAACGQGGLLPLDLSYESLDRLEDYLFLVVDSKAKIDLAKLRSRGGRYVAATLVERAAGKWVASKKDKKAVVSGLPGARKAEFNVAPIVADVMRMRQHYVGYLRDDTEAYDLALRKRQLAELRDSAAARLQELRADVKALTGKDPGPLDGSVDSLTLIEVALKQTVTGRAPREQRRRMRAATVLYAGIILEKARKVTWSVSDRVGDRAFGWFLVNGWAPAYAVRFIAPESPAGKLKSQVEYRMPRGRRDSADDDDDGSQA